MPIATLLFLAVATLVVILYARGYQLSFNTGKPQLTGSGILVVTSDPDGAEVFINGHLTTATNNTINLAPDTYDVSIKKDGYLPWERTVKVNQEVVTKLTAYLFPIAPQLENITELGVSNPVVDPSGTKIAYTVASQSAKKNGVYVLNMNNNMLLTLQSGSQQITDDTTDTFSQSQLSWSPDGTKLVASMSAKANAKPVQYLLDATSFNSTPQDITETYADVTNGWAKDREDKITAKLSALPLSLRTFLSTNAANLVWSPDDSQIFYQATQAATLEPMMKPLPDSNTVTQQRVLQPGTFYVYSIKEDKNFALPVSVGPDIMPHWFFDSRHIVYVQNKQVTVVDSDGSNQHILYAGPFVDGFAIPWPTGSKIVILTNLGNSEIVPNLYTINLR